MEDSSIPQSTYERKVLGWAQEALQEGDNFLKGQKGFDKIDETMRAVFSDFSGDVKSPKLSTTSSNRLGKIALDMASALTDVKPFWDYRTFNADYGKQATIFNKLSAQWWNRRNIGLKFCDVIKYSLVGATGYAHIKWNQSIQDQDMGAIDPRDLVPIRIPDHNYGLQDAYGVIYRRELTVNYAKQCWPSKAALIKADRDSFSSGALNNTNTRYGKVIEAMGLSPFRERLFGNRPKANIGGTPCVDVYTMYVKDESRNKTGGSQLVGEWDDDLADFANNHSYLVRPGDPMYPNKRVIIFTRTAVLYDGPNPYWHGMFPFTKVTIDPWPWSWLGKGPLWDLLELQKTYNKQLRIMEDHFEKMARPDIIADKNSTSKAQLQRLDSRRAGNKMEQNPSAGKGIQIVPTQPMDPSIVNYFNIIREEMSELAGKTDLQGISQLNQLPSADTLDKLAEGMTPSIRMRSRVLEGAVNEIAQMVASNFAQFYTTRQRFAILGPDGLSYDDFDFDPGSLIPDIVHDHYKLDPNAPDELGPDAPAHGRAKAFLRSFSFHIAPASLLNASHMEKKLMYLQLFRAGVLDPWTLLEELDVPNVGQPPGDTITERLASAQQMGFVGAVSSAGRKSSGQAPPQMRPDGIISESG